MKEYEVTIYVDGMEFPHIGTLSIVADTREQAKAWVRDKIHLQVKPGTELDKEPIVLRRRK